MNRIVSAIALSTVMTVAAAPSVLAMGQEFNMLTGAIYNELTTRGLDTSGINDLTVGQLALIKAIVESDDSEADKNNRIEAVLAR